MALSMKNNRAVLVLALAGVFAAAGLAVGFILPTIPFRGRADAGRNGKGLVRERGRHEWNVYDALQGYRFIPGSAGSHVRLYPRTYGGGIIAAGKNRSRQIVSGPKAGGGHEGGDWTMIPSVSWPEAVRHRQWPDLHPVIVAWPDTGGRGSDGDGAEVQYPIIFIPGGQGPVTGDISNPGDDGSGDNIGENPGTEEGTDDNPVTSVYGPAGVSWGDGGPAGSPTPVPGAVWLLGSGLVVCWCLRKTKNKLERINADKT
jgi:hypothetical protein